MNSRLKRYVGMSLSAIALTGTIGCGAKTNNIDLSADKPSEPVKQEQVMPTSKDSQDDVVISMPTMPPIENTVEQELEGPLNPPTPECVDNRPENNNQLMQQYTGSIGNGYIVVYYHNNITEDQLYNCAVEPVYIEKTIFIPDDSIDGVIKVSVDDYKKLQSTKTIKL